VSDRPVALVTGSSRGIGRAIAEQLAKDGFATIVNYHRNSAAAHEVVSHIQSDDGVAVAVQANVALGEDRDGLIRAAMDTFGRLDILVNNAGITSQGRKDVLEATEESFDLVFDTNLKGPFFLAQKAACRMIELVQGNQIPGGKIINVSSISAWLPCAGNVQYAATKPMANTSKPGNGLRFGARMKSTSMRAGIIRTSP